MEYDKNKQGIKRTIVNFSSSVVNKNFSLDPNTNFIRLFVTIDWNTNMTNKLNYGNDLKFNFYNTNQEYFTNNKILTKGTTKFISNCDNINVMKLSVIENHKYAMSIISDRPLNLNTSFRINVDAPISSSYRVAPGHETFEKFVYFTASSSAKCDVKIYTAGVTGDDGYITVSIYDITNLNEREEDIRVKWYGKSNIVSGIGGPSSVIVPLINLREGHMYRMFMKASEDASSNDDNIIIGVSYSTYYHTLQITQLKNGVFNHFVSKASHPDSYVYYDLGSETSASGMITIEVEDLTAQAIHITNGSEYKWRIGRYSNDMFYEDGTLNLSSELIRVPRGTVIYNKKRDTTAYLYHYDSNKLYKYKEGWHYSFPLITEDEYVRIVIQNSTLTDENDIYALANNIEILNLVPVPTDLTKIINNNYNNFSHLLATNQYDLLTDQDWEIGFLATTTGMPSTSANNYALRTTNYIDISEFANKTLKYVYDDTNGAINWAGRIYFYDSNFELIRYVPLSGASSKSIQIAPEEKYTKCMVTDNWTASQFTNIYYSSYVHLYAQLDTQDTDQYTLYNKIYTTPINNTKIKIANYSEAGRISYGFLTDNHLNTQWSENNLAQARQLKALIDTAKNTAIDFVVLGGDLIDVASSRENASKLAEAFFSYAEFNNVKVAVITGNHDDNCYGEVQTKSWLRNMLIDRSTVNAVFPNETACYYYFDVPNKNYRIICLDTIDYEEYNERTGQNKIGSNWWSLSESQVKWFCETAIRTDRNIAIMTHMTPEEACNSWGLGDNGGYHTDLINAILAYNNKSTITLYGNTYDFSTVNGKIKFMHFGHKHIELLEDYTIAGIPGINTGCGKIQNQNISENEEKVLDGDEYTYILNDNSAAEFHSNATSAQYYKYRHFVPRVAGEISESLIDFVSVNSDTIHTFRLGIGFDRTYNYTN